DIFHKVVVGVELLILHFEFNGIDQIGGGKGFAVRPSDALAQGDREACEILIISWVVSGRAVDDLAGGKVDGPERLVRQVLHSAVLPLPADPVVEVVRCTDAPGQDSGDQSLLTGESAALSECYARSGKLFRDGY